MRPSPAGWRTAATKNLPLTLAFPDGTRWGAGGPRLELVRPERFFARLGADGLIGFGEAWMTGDMTTGGWQRRRQPRRRRGAGQQHRSGVRQRRDRRAGRRADRAVPSGCPCWSRARCRSCGTPGRTGRRPTEENTPTGARENIHRHYDLSNDLFELFLDPTLTYSAAWFEPGDDLLTRAAPQDRRHPRPGQGRARAAGAGDRLRLGWAGHPGRPGAGRARHHPDPVRGAEGAGRPADRRGRAERPDRRACWRTTATTPTATSGTYDAIVSVEMIEAVGERYWPDYFGAIDRMLADGGRMSLQAITMAHERLLATRNGYTWVHKYVFPGGTLPSTDRDRSGGQRAHLAADPGDPAARACPTCRPWSSGGTTSTTGCRRSARWASTRRSSGCGTSTWPTRRPGFAADYLDDLQIGLGRG